MNKIFLFLIALVLSILPVITASFAENDRKADYAIWQSYGSSWKHDLTYPNFTLHFVAEEEGAPYPGSDRKMSPVYVFEVKNEDEVQKLRWSEGTGDISPLFFTVKGRNFVFEMKCSEVVTGCEATHKVLIWEEEDFLKRKAKKLP